MLANTRTRLSNVEHAYDAVIIGGGITGAAIFHELARRGLNILLVEQRDYSWGTSSRSSKMIHGGLRYLKRGNVKLSWQSVRAREQLMRELAGLVDPLNFLLVSNPSRQWEHWLVGALLPIYDLMAQNPRRHQRLSATQVHDLAPGFAADKVSGGYLYTDGVTDDARLVLRLINAGLAAGGTARNYCRANQFLRDDAGAVHGIQLEDTVSGDEATVTAQTIINATGIWMNNLYGDAPLPYRIRPLRGSHLVLQRDRLPVDKAVVFQHDDDGRYVFVYPWETVTVVGTTDVDHGKIDTREPHISAAEFDYLLRAVQTAYPAHAIDDKDIMATFAGIRPIVDAKQGTPSAASRDHVVWQHDNVLTVAGGKYTTFRYMVADVAEHLQTHFPALHATDVAAPVFDDDVEDMSMPAMIDAETACRLRGWYGAALVDVLALATPDDLMRIPGTPYLYGEIVWALQREQVVYLEDLLLRRTRLGYLLPEGARSLRARLRDIAVNRCGWSEATFDAQWQAYLEVWQRSYAPQPFLADAVNVAV